MTTRRITIRRREFGRQALRIAAGLGVTSVSLGGLGGLGLLGSCADGSGSSFERLDGAETPRQLPARKGGMSVLIIGSGYGSAVTALRLTQAGIPVTMLEAGRLWNTPGPDGKVFCNGFSPDGRAMWFQDAMEGVVKSVLGFPFEFEVPVEAGILEASGPQEMRCYQGKGVGGGSLVNMSIYLAPERAKLKSILPFIDQDEFYDKYIPRAKAVLGAASPTAELLESECYRYSRVGLAAAEAAGFKSGLLESGYDYQYMERELEDAVPRSALGGEAGFGNNHGKKSLDKTYIAEALGTGLLTLRALHVAKRIRTSPGGGYVVDVENIDTQGNVLKREELTCTHLFVGAGSLATSELLVRAREHDLPDLNDAVGTKWGPNGDLFVALDHPLWTPTGDLQSTIPAQYFVAHDGEGRRVVSEFVPFPSGLPSWQSFIIVLADNPEAGYFSYDSQKDTVDLRWQRAQNEPSVAAAKHIFDQINAKAGTSYSEVIGLGDRQFGDQVTYHPVGGVPLGDATDEYGRIREYPGLYVVDGSLLPIGIGANPSLAITALAERNIERIIATDLAG